MQQECEGQCCPHSLGWITEEKESYCNYDQKNLKSAAAMGLEAQVLSQKHMDSYASAASN